MHAFDIEVEAHFSLWASWNHVQTRHDLTENTGCNRFVIVGYPYYLLTETVYTQCGETCIVISHYAQLF